MNDKTTETAEVILKVVEIPNNYNDKVEMIRCILDDVKKRKNQHYKQFGKYRKINTLNKSLVITVQHVFYIKNTLYI